MVLISSNPKTITKQIRSLLLVLQVLLIVALIVLPETTSFTIVSKSLSIIRTEMSTENKSSTETTTTTTTSKVNESKNDDDVGISTPTTDEEIIHQEFLIKTRQLCKDRNIQFIKIKNARDLASAAGSTVRPGRIYRMGRVSDATVDDIQLLFEELQIQTLVDLRSPTEWKDDPTLLRDDVFGNFTNLLWKERRAGKPDCLKELQPGQSPVVRKSDSTKKFWNRSSSSVSTASKDSDTIDDAAKIEEAIRNDKVVLVTEDDALIFDDAEECTLDCEDPKGGGIEVAVPVSSTSSSERKERHFVSLMNEFKYVKGTVSKVRKRDITKALLKAPGAVFSKRVRSSLKKPFLDEINGGGLPMLNELLLRFGAPGIRYVLELCADPKRHPIAFYCTAGKDRTGILAAIILSLCQVPEDAIVEDYTLSANVYAEMNDHQAMVGALSQRSLDPKIFLGAPAHVMKDTIDAINEQYGSVEGYCNWIGFTTDKQQQLRDACMK